jgi:transcriptional regulator with XRE-family HTH domain
VEEKSTFGKYILLKRRQLDLSQKMLADKLYISESAVSKWERGISYPDITLVTSLCEALEISEHELITSCDDSHQQVIERQAKNFKKIVKVFSVLTYLLYSISLLICFICNLAIEKKLSWFFNVLFSELVVFSLINVPILVHKLKKWITLIAFYLSLNLVLLSGCIYSAGKWYGVAFVSVLFAFILIFMPFILSSVVLPQRLQGHKAVLCIGADSIMLFILVTISYIYNTSIDMNRLMTEIYPVTLFCIVLPWAYVIIIRYLKCNMLFKTAICLLLNGLYLFFGNSILDVLIDHTAFSLAKIKLNNWGWEYYNGNLLLIILLGCIFFMTIFVVGGVALEVKGGKKS